MILITIAVFTGLIIGAAVHESSHAIAAVLLGGEVTHIDPVGMTVGVRFDADAPLWHTRAVGAAPVVTAIAIALSAILAPYRISPVGILAVACVLIMNTLFLSKADIAMITRPEASSA